MGYLAYESELDGVPIVVLVNDAEYFTETRRVVLSRLIHVHRYTEAVAGWISKNTIHSCGRVSGVPMGRDLARELHKLSPHYPLEAAMVARKTESLDDVWVKVLGLVAKNTVRFTMPRREIT